MVQKDLTNDPTAVATQVQAAYLAMFPQADTRFVPLAFGWALDCFCGHYAGYQAVDTRYHDFEHTLQGTLCMARLLHGRHIAGAQRPLPRRLVELGLLAILLHDTGYLKKRDDTKGTGAKYTVTHVQRSAAFAAQLLGQKGSDQHDIIAVQNMIRCTGVDALLSTIPFQDDLERTAGRALGTADLLGQMAADDYVEKLPILYAEFAEAAAFTKDRTHLICLFTSADDLMQKTPIFWEKYVRMKLDREFGGLHQFLKSPYPDGPNPYLKRIEANIERVRQAVAAKRQSNSR
ncbi:MAG: hypothetical protein KGJ60_01350 [Verrucomicrobiota bacterium]|nr:hypothetical protein [Verrucomicrobiota bacterium]